MPFIPHSDRETQAMLSAIGVDSIEALFDEVPETLRARDSFSLPEAISEAELMQEMRRRARQDRTGLCFLGAGAYEHHIPGAVWDLASRGEYLTAYTPYQAEASQGTLQTIYEFQTMLASLMAMDVANASVYDGASALAEAMLMAVRANRKTSSRTLLVPGGLHPHYRQTAEAITRYQELVIEDMPVDGAGRVALDALTHEEAAALVIMQPNFFGGLEPVAALTDWAHARNMLVIAVVNPTSLALLTPPGQWGATGADIAVGEGQTLGIPLASGGPYLGLMTCRQSLVRQLPGRLVGRTRDLDGKPGFTLTLQAREQHIRRGKATSNICTNQGLLVTAATIYLSLLGPTGLRRVAQASHAGACWLRRSLLGLDGIGDPRPGPVFNEFVIQLPEPEKGDGAEAFVRNLLHRANIIAGLPLAAYGHPHQLLVNVTETKSRSDLESYLAAADAAVSELAVC